MVGNYVPLLDIMGQVILYLTAYYFRFLLIQLTIRDAGLALVLLLNWNTRITAKYAVTIYSN